MASQPQSSSAAARDSDRSGLFGAMGIVVLFLASMAATVPLIEFSNGGESLVVTTATETRRTGHWLIPTLNSVPRMNKPPLPMWLAAMAISESTMQGMDSPDSELRGAAFRTLIWQARWPAVLSSALAILVAYQLGMTLSGRHVPIGWVSAAACASLMLFVRNARLATTDVQLMLWVAVANLCIAKALIEGRRWWGAIGAGLAIGLAMMSKGPVALVQTVVPLISFAAWRWWRRRDEDLPPAPNTWIAPTLTGTAAALLVGLPWYVLILIRDRNVAKWWLAEVTREGATDLPASAWYNYLVFVPLLAPWTVFFFVGVIGCIRDALGTGVARLPLRGFPDVDDAPPAAMSTDAAALSPLHVKRRADGMILGLMMVVLPIVVMSFFRDRKDRYLLPMAIPAAVVIARGVAEYVAVRAGGGKTALIAAVHWLVIGALSIGLAIGGATSSKLQTIDGRQWFSPALAVSAAVVFAAILATGIYSEHTRRRGMVITTTFLFLLMQVLFMWGYRDSDEGRSEMRPLAESIWRSYPDAQMWTSGPRPAAIPADLPLYLNRPVVWIDSVEALKPEAYPRVVVIRQRRSDPPSTLPDGWRPLSSVNRGNNRWHAFVLPAK